MTPRPLFALVFLAPAAAAAVVSGGGCSGIQNQRIGIDAPPYSKTEFRPVGDYLGARCGTLDCHGQIGRNLRIYSCSGMRAEPDASPVSCQQQTTDEEYQRTYRSLVALEPQVMSTVYAGCASPDAGMYPPGESCHPELLTFIRKARGIEAHKGGQLICVQSPCPDGVPDPVQADGGDPVITCPNGNCPSIDEQDVCLVTFLEGATDRAACGQAFGIPQFPVLDAGTE